MSELRAASSRRNGSYDTECLMVKCNEWNRTHKIHIQSANTHMLTHERFLLRVQCNKTTRNNRFRSYRMSFLRSLFYSSLYSPLWLRIFAHLSTSGEEDSPMWWGNWEMSVKLFECFAQFSSHFSFDTWCSHSLLISLCIYALGWCVCALDFVFSRVGQWMALLRSFLNCIHFIHSFLLFHLTPHNVAKQSQCPSQFQEIITWIGITAFVDIDDDDCVFFLATVVVIVVFVEVVCVFFLLISLINLFEQIACFMILIMWFCKFYIQILQIRRIIHEHSIMIICIHISLDIFHRCPNVKNEWWRMKEKEHHTQREVWKKLHRT